MPQAFGGAIIAALGSLRKGWAVSPPVCRQPTAAFINILFGTVLATIGQHSGSADNRKVNETVGDTWSPGRESTSAAINVAVSVVTFTSRKTNVLQGCVHLLLFAVFVLLIFAPYKSDRSSIGACSNQACDGIRELSTYARLRITTASGRSSATLNTNRS